MSAENPAVPAATVVVLRDGPSGPEALLVRRSSKLAFAGGMWVFPGGRIDPADHVDRAPQEPGDLDDLDPLDRVNRGAGGPRELTPAPRETDDHAAAAREPDDLTAAARRAAVREAREEAGIVLSPDALVWFSHWTPPAMSPKRFATWFFATRASGEEVTVDGGEIRDHVWTRPADALARRNALEIELGPPTWITLSHLAAFESVGEALATLDANEPEYFATRIAMVDGGAVALYDGDAGYDDTDPTRPGSRHRLWMLQDGWRYEREPAPPARPRA